MKNISSYNDITEKDQTMIRWREMISEYEKDKKELLKLNHLKTKKRVEELTKIAKEDFIASLFVTAVMTLVVVVIVTLIKIFL